MTCNGLVYKIDGGVYLSLIDPDNNDAPTDGIPITKNTYSELKDNEVYYVEVTITDETENIELSIKEFMDNFSNYEVGDVYYKLIDIFLFSYNDTIKNISIDGNFNELSSDIVDQVEHIKLKNKK